MKSPWKFLVRLTRRSEKDDVSEVPASSVDPKSLDREGTAAPAPVVDAAPTSRVDDAEIPATVPVDEPEHIDDLATLAAIAAASAKGKEESPAVKKQRRRRNVAVDLRTRERPTAGNRLTQFDDRFALDDEIAQLRLELRRKLELQNAQLRQMLERFER